MSQNLEANGNTRGTLRRFFTLRKPAWVRNFCENARTDTEMRCAVLGLAFPANAINAMRTTEVLRVYLTVNKLYLQLQRLEDSRGDARLLADDRVWELLGEIERASLELAESNAGGDADERERLLRIIADINAELEPHAAAHREVADEFLVGNEDHARVQIKLTRIVRRAMNRRSK